MKKWEERTSTANGSGVAIVTDWHDVQLQHREYLCVCVFNERERNEMGIQFTVA